MEVVVVRMMMEIGRGPMVVLVVAGRVMVSVTLVREV